MDEDYSIELALIRSVTRPPIAEAKYAMSWRNGKRWVYLGWGCDDDVWILNTHHRNIWTGSGKPKRRRLSFAGLHEHLTNPRFAKYWRIAPR